MNDNNLFENAFNAIDDEFLAEAKHPSIRIAARRKKIIISSIAACVAAVLVAIPSIKVISDLNDNKFTTSDDTEVIIKEEITSSEQIQSEDTINEPQSNISSGTTGVESSSKSQGSQKPDTNAALNFTPPYTDITVTANDLFNNGIATNGSTTSYTKTYVPSVEYLYIKPMPIEKYVTIYEHFPVEQKEPTEAEFRAYVDKYLPKIADATGTILPECNIEKAADGGYRLSTIGKTEDVNIYIAPGYISLGKSFIYTENDVPLTIYGETVVIDQTKTDAEIFTSLSGIKDKLGKLFGTTFEYSTITRRFSSYTTNGAEWIYVYFKSTDDSGSLYITFDNFDNGTSDTVSSTYIYNADITYLPNDSETSANSISKQVELLPLEKAEDYLSKGYVVSLYGCPLCQENQEPVDFTDYDYVSFSYSIYNNKEIPFYAFYKNIGTAKNGNMTFAYTYVPAVEVEGYEEYFINKHNNHNTKNSDNDYVLEDNGE